jgi:hypothetical protein
MSTLACASAGPPAESAPVERVVRVPATPPNFQPPELEVGLVSDRHGNLVSTNVLSVYFEFGTTQPDRQSAIDLVGGTVIGGVRSGQDGWYYVEVIGDGTLATIFEIAHTLDALPQVSLASPYIRYRFGTSHGQQSWPRGVESD